MSFSSFTFEFNLNHLLRPFVSFSRKDFYPVMGNKRRRIWRSRLFLEGGVDEQRKEEGEREFCKTVRGKQHERTGQEEALVVLGQRLI